jgi:release factor glutamine methyltransferase
MTVGEARKEAGEWLHKNGVTSNRLDSELLLAHVLNKDRSWVLAHEDHELTAEERQMYAIIVQKRTKRIPLVHLTGKREFYGIEIKITPDVLTPRAETEKLVEWVINDAPKNSTLIDIGTGSGALAIAIGLNRPDIIITATEVSLPALRVARINADNYNLELNLIESDIWKSVEGKFSTVIANLPYLRDDAKEILMEEVKYEPEIALFGGKDGLDLYRRLFKNILDHLNPGGILFLECDPWQHEALIELAKQYDFKIVKESYFILGFQNTTTS